MSNSSRIAAPAVRFTIACLVIFLSVSSESSGAKDRHVQLFLKGIEALDFEKWRVASVYFSEVLEADLNEPLEGSRKDIWDYGQRWIAYLPHFFLGIALFEIGAYEEAEREWQTSLDEIELIPKARRRRNLEKYKRWRSQEHALSEKYAEEVALQREYMLFQLLRARGAADKIGDAASTLAEAEREAIDRSLAAVQSAGIDFRAALEGVPSATQWESELPLDLDRFSRARAEHSRLIDLEASVRKLETDLDETAGTVEDLLLASLQRWRQPVGKMPESGTSARAAGRARPRPVYVQRPGPPNLAQVWQALSDYQIAKLLVSTGSRRFTRETAIARLEDSLWLAAEVEALQDSAPPSLSRLLNLYEPYTVLLRAYHLLEDQSAAQALIDGHADEVAPAALERFDRWLRGEDSVYPGNSHALLIGIWDYDPPGPQGDQDWDDLPGVKRDYDAVHTLFSDLGFQILALPNPKTATEIEEAMKQISRLLQPDDRLLVYYAGHGYTSEDDYGNSVGWMVPAAAPHAGHDDFLYALVDMEAWKNWAAKILKCDKARHKLFVLDTCFSGHALGLEGKRLAPAAYQRCTSQALSLAGESGTDRGSDAAESRGVRALSVADDARPFLIRLKVSRPMTIMISAGESKERVPDDSIFRQKFVEALRAPPPAGLILTDGFVLGSNLGQHLENVVEAATAGLQSPEWEKQKGKGDWVFEVSQAAQPSDRKSDSPADESALLVLGDVNKWEQHSRAGSYAAYLRDNPDGPFADLARAMVLAEAIAETHDTT